MAKPKPLAEVPLLCLLPREHQEPLQPYLACLQLKKVEVIPQEKKWVLHFASEKFVEQDILNQFARHIKKRVPEVDEIQCLLECRTKIDTAEELLREYRQEVAQDLNEVLPGLRGWLQEEERIKVDGNDIHFFAPNTLGLEYFKSKQRVIEKYFATKYGLEVKVSYSLQISEEDDQLDAQREAEERKILQELLSAQTSKPKETTAPLSTPSSVILGREFQGEPISICEVQDEEKQEQQQHKSLLTAFIANQIDVQKFNKKDYQNQLKIDKKALNEEMME